jgi:hypothetical protein
MAKMHHRGSKSTVGGVEEMLKTTHSLRAGMGFRIMAAFSQALLARWGGAQEFYAPRLA